MRGWNESFMRNNKRFAGLLAVCAVMCAAIALLSVMLGRTFISPASVVRIIFGGEEGSAASILRYSRIPRCAAALLSGAALAVAGAVLQNVLANRLASPGIIGVNAGAGLGVNLCLFLGFLSGWAVSLFAFGGSLLAVGVISLFASRTNASRSTVILGGVALNSILGAMSEALSVLDSDVAALSAEFRVGGFSSVSYTRLIPAAVMIGAALLILFTLLDELDVLSLGDETAQSLGLCAGRYRVIFLILSALLAGAAVSFTGLLGFVGLIVPHFVRSIVGNEGRRLIPLSALAGAGFVCLCDTVSRMLFAPYELPVGILMSVIGGPLFVVMLVRMKGGGRRA